MQIVKKSWEIAWKNKYLWWFGIILSFTGIGTTYNANFFPKNSQNIGQNYILPFISQHLFWIILAGVIILILFALLLILGIFARAGMILEINNLLKKNPLGFRKSFRKGGGYFWQIFFLNILLSLFACVAIVILASPVAFCLFNNSYISGIILLLLAILVMIPILFLIYYIKNYGLIYIVLGDLKTWPAIENSYALFQKNLASSLILFLVFIAVGIISSVVLVVIIFGIVLVFGILAFALYFAAKIAAFVVGVLGVLALLVAIFLFKALMIVLIQSIWVLFFQEIAKLKMEEKVEEKVAEPQIVSNPGPII